MTAVIRPPARRPRSIRARSECNERNDDFARGARAAADVADGYNSSTTHDHRLGDCILAKLNIRAGRPRRNVQRIDRPDRAWSRGFAQALVDILDHQGGEGRNASVVAVTLDAGVCLADLRDAGVVDVDLRRLGDAGVPVRWKKKP